jgi:NTP pyrophosphatase (non-canonical NTP hydrolase)
MNFTDYQSAALRTASPDSLASPSASLTMAALGLCGEAGEFAELAKKHLFHGHSLDRDKAAKEIGDVLWYVAFACESLGVSMNEIAERNIAKLKARYPDQFETHLSLVKDETRE